MFEKDEIGDSAEDFGSGEDSKDNHGGGDGMHHHEIHEDEAGGYHSKHTHPDGRVEHADHADYEEAKDHMDRMHGHGEPDGDEGPDDSGEIDTGDIAGSYGRAAKH